MTLAVERKRGGDKVNGRVTLKSGHASTLGAIVFCKRVFYKKVGWSVLAGHPF
jgi:hypothetical protein